MNNQADRSPIELSCDVLVVGGGFAGLNAAIEARLAGAVVTLVDKASVASSGASTMCDGLTTGPLRGQDLEPWINEFVVHGEYLADPAWARFVLEEQIGRLEMLDRLGPVLFRDEAGNLGQYSSRGMLEVKCVQFNPKMAVELLRAQARALGVTILDRICVSDLLTSDGLYPTNDRVCGAAGFHARTGQSLVFWAGAVVLATGPIAIKGFHVVDNDTGDGNALASRVGAVHQDMEFATGGNFSVLARHYRLSIFNVGVAHGVKMINKDGLRFMEQYDPIRIERTELSRVTAAWIKELIEGRGPVYLDFRDCDETYWDDLKSIRGRAAVESLFESGLLPDPRTEPIEIEPTRSYWSNGRGGVEIDLECRTAVPGLFGAGAVAKNNAPGTHSSAGIPTAFAMTTGARAGRLAAEETLGHPVSTYPGVADEVLHRTWQPYHRTAGITPDQAHQRIAAIIGNPMDTLLLNATKLQSALDAFDDLRIELDQHLHAPDIHELVKATEATNTIEWCELVLASMLDRTESREGFYREDYPYTDDFQWRCWHLVQREADGKLVFTTKQVPYHDYPTPPPPPRRELSAIGHILHSEHPMPAHN